MHTNDDELLEKLRQKLGPFEKKDERSELERLFGKREETEEDRLRKQLVKPSIQINDEVDLHIEKLAFGGDGIAKWKNTTIFVPGTVPGDSVKVRISHKKQGVFYAEIVERITGSSDRVPPICPAFGKCGGCNLQNLVYTAQLKAKKIMLQDTLKNLADIDTSVRNVIRSPDTVGYRLRSRFHVDSSDRELKIGFYAPESHIVIPIHKCPLLAPILNEILDNLYSILPAPGTAPLPTEIQVQCNNEASEATIHFVSKEPLLYFDALWTTIQKKKLPVTGISSQTNGNIQSLGKPFVTHHLKSIAVSIPSNGFSQANRYLLNQFLDQILMISSPVGQDKVLDLYCGAGFFSLFIAKYVKQVVGIDGHGPSIRSAQNNAETFGNCSFFEAQEEHFFSLPEIRKEDFTLVIADPPRSGLHPQILTALQSKKPPRILYISCYPGTLARDLAKLTASDYRIRVIQPLDMFPHTHHIESIVFLTHRYTSKQAASAVFRDFR